MSKPVNNHALLISYGNNSWQALDMDGGQIPLSVADDGVLPVLPDGNSAERLLLPVEQLLCRSFSLSLAHPRFIDADILAQELNERAGENQEDWWLAWQAAKDGDGVAGLVFGLPEPLRRQINENSQWQQLASVGVDVWDRLEVQLASYVEAADLAEGSVAVFDADAEGVFFGIWEKVGDKTAAGIWRGMRRLNVGQEFDAEAWAWQIRRSLQAMGWQDGDAATGRLGKHLMQALVLKNWHGDLPETMVDEARLPDRLTANLTLPARSLLEFRHGQWAAQSGLGWIRPWRRSMALAAMLVLAWVLGLAWQVHGMDAQLAQYKERINVAFHQGLPDEPVMIDALAQLRQATGGGSANEAAEWLNQLSAIGRAYGEKPWAMRELSFHEGVMKISGKANDLQELNSIRGLLQRETGRDVQLADTDLSGQQVAFRMHWQ